MATLLVLSEDLKTENTQTFPKINNTSGKSHKSDPSANVSLEKKAGTEMKAVLACLCSGSGALFCCFCCCCFFWFFFNIQLQVEETFRKGFCEPLTPPHFLTPSPTFRAELYLHKRSTATSSSSIYSLGSLPLCSPYSKLHEIYTTFQLNANKGCFSWGFHGAMVESPR